jgi:hypothetical protein
MHLLLLLAQHCVMLMPFAALLLDGVLVAVELHCRALLRQLTPRARLNMSSPKRLSWLLLLLTAATICCICLEPSLAVTSRQCLLHTS